MNAGPQFRPGFRTPTASSLAASHDAEIAEFLGMSKNDVAAFFKVLVDGTFAAHDDRWSLHHPAPSSLASEVTALLLSMSSGQKSGMSFIPLYGAVNSLKAAMNAIRGERALTSGQQTDMARVLWAAPRKDLSSADQAWYDDISASPRITATMHPLLPKLATI